MKLHQLIVRFFTALSHSAIGHPRRLLVLAAVITLTAAPGVMRLKLRTDGHEGVLSIGNSCIQLRKRIQFFAPGSHARWLHVLEGHAVGPSEPSPSFGSFTSVISFRKIPKVKRAAAESSPGQHLNP